MSPSSIEDRLDASFAPAWRPDVDDRLIGEVVALSERDGGYGSYPILTIRRDGGEELAVHAMHDVLSRELAKLRPAVGDRLAIKYCGKVSPKSGAGAPYHSYKVVSDAAAGGVDWGRYGDGDGDGDGSGVGSGGGSDLPSSGGAAAEPAAPADDVIPF